MKKITSNVNVFFTGRYLKIWYIVAFLIILIMMWGWRERHSVQEFEMHIFNPNGTLQSSQIIPASEAKFRGDSLPVTKSFKPVK